MLQVVYRDVLFNHCMSYVAGSVSSDDLRRILFKEVINGFHSLDRQTMKVYDDPQISVHAIKNTRRKMEDRHVLLPYFSQLFKV